VTRCGRRHGCIHEYRGEFALLGQLLQGELQMIERLVRLIVFEKCANLEEARLSVRRRQAYGFGGVLDLAF
jgi:hypothetical protein